MGVVVKLFFERILLIAVLAAGAFVGAGLLGVGGAKMDSEPSVLSTQHSALQADDPHEGQPDHCTNAKNAPAAHKCACAKTEDACDVEDKKCKVYCRKDHCHCFHPSCDS